MEMLSFRCGHPVVQELTVAQAAWATKARLDYRHVTQAERYRTADMALTDQGFRATIPAE